MPEVDAQRRVVKLSPQFVHLIDQELQAFHLHVRAWKTVDDGAVLVLRSKQLAQQQPDHFAIADELAGILNGPSFRGIHQRTDDDRRTRKTEDSTDERRVCSFSGARSSSEKNQLFGKTKVGATIFQFKILPDGVED